MVFGNDSVVLCICLTENQGLCLVLQLFLNLTPEKCKCLSSSVDSHCFLCHGLYRGPLYTLFDVLLL
jgi:hypothetical protein